MSYDIEDFEKKEDKNKGMVGTTIFHGLLLFLLIFPWFTTVYPIPEAEGLMASFGDVEIAGGGSENPNEEIVEPVEEPVTEPVEDVNDTETIDDKESPVVVEDKPKDNPTPVNDKPKVDDNSMFKGTKNGGKGTGQGDGTQGKPDGKGDLGGTGKGTKGDGDGAIGSRRNIEKCDDFKKSNAVSWREKGKAVIRICVNAQGKVVSAEFIRKKSTITSQKLIEMVVECAKNYRYDRAPGKPNACGEITISLGIK